MKLHSRIFLLLMSLLLGLAIASMGFLYSSARENVELETEQRLVTAQRSFTDSLQNQQTFLSQNVVTVARDWGLRQAVGQRDTETMESVLANHSRRIGADVALFVDSQGTMLASTDLDIDHLPDELWSFLNNENEQRLGLAKLAGRYYQLVFVEVMAPLSMGWIGMGFVVDDALAMHHSQVTGVDISFMETAESGFAFVGSSLNADQKKAINDKGVITQGIWQVSSPGWEDLALYSELGNHAAGLGVLLQSSLNEPLARFQSWWMSLLSIYLAITLLALGLAYVFARGITRPLHTLMKAAGDIARGDYSTPLDSKRRDEIGFLSRSFAHMQGAISERENEIQYQAHHDSITDALNRAGFIHRLQDEIKVADEKGTHLIVACCGLNHFKDINDSLGHNWGDKLLAIITERLEQRFNKHCIANLNSSEFAVLISTDRVTNAYHLAEQIHQCFANEFNIRGIALSVSSTIGIAAYPENAPDAQGLLRLASVAANEAKQRHLTTMVYDPALDQNSIKRLTLMSELPSAVRNGDLELYYQPQVSALAEQRTVHGVECLVRWKHADLGFVPPDEFIGLAEKTGYIVELTEWVLTQALAQFAIWRKQKYHLTLSVNISALDIQREGFEELLLNLLQSHQIPAEMLTLEITESAAMRDPEASIAQLKKLHKLGVRLAIDDYGAGYSSLAYLKKMPVHELKIDKSFVTELDRDKDDETIVRSTIELGHNMGLAVVAEGVEDARVAWELERLGCDILQGYYVSKPLPVASLNQWLQENSRQVPSVTRIVDKVLKT
ncbi:EAL domain-containing protein [Halioglobus maricola]|uniref:EAL domain-containing protein n=1 Tax=Halioglobus maricola TaxID=2601894 RepID=A0A5P9NL92_9GAMM|nr:EAL domain-containing protein [Halioglobus maricola]QFU76266.1 EAL domain-containing protein [Halioglobus maricola]